MEADTSPVSPGVPGDPWDPSQGWVLGHRCLELLDLCVHRPHPALQVGGAGIVGHMLGIDVSEEKLKRGPTPD